jgi:hypothetical protein
MSAKTLLILSATVWLGLAVGPNPAHAQFGLPPAPPPAFSGPPPGIAGGPALGGPPAGLMAGLPSRGPAGAPPRGIAGGPPRLDGAGGLRGLDRGGQANFRGVEARAGGYSANGYGRSGYASSGYGRGYRYGTYAATAAAYAYDRSYSSSDDGCYYVSSYRRYGTRRVLVCRGD